MIRAAAAARQGLGKRADRAARFVFNRQVRDGGFAGRSPSSDLYYTSFALLCLCALGRDYPAGPIAQYLASFGDGASLDLVHRCCLARCWSFLPERPGLTQAAQEAILARIGSYRSCDGGFAPVAGAQRGTAYGCFLALGAYEDLGAELHRPNLLATCVQNLQTSSGGFANEPGIGLAGTPSTAAAVVLLEHLGRPVPPAAVSWLLARFTPQGGACAAEVVPASDLLSTATALHAMNMLGVRLDAAKEGSCLEYVRGLQTADGGFCATSGDSASADGDCEYTFYGLLAMGSLSQQDKTPRAEHGNGDDGYPLDST